jgi:formylmethanofuran dehydrogenase subunit C
MAIELEFIGQSTVPVEVEGVIPSVVGAKPLDAIRRLMVYQGNREVPLGELFRVSGDGSDGQIVWSGNLSGVHWIGAKMDAGKITIHGDAGRHIGSEMTAGQIVVRGNAGDWVGAEMHGGLIEVKGHAGHLVGAAYRGSPQGMTGGAVLVHGDVGNEIGHSMRRGLIAIGGASGDLIGLNMRAGTILAWGQPGIRHGAGMKRGTLVFLHSTPPLMLPTFRHACGCRPLIFALLGRKLCDWGFPRSELLTQQEYDLHHGDMLEGGRGELFTVRSKSFDRATL